MPKNTMDDLRNMLFETVERLMDKDDSMDIAKAEAVAKVSQTIINSRKLEIDAYKAVGQFRGNVYEFETSKLLKGLENEEPVNL